MRLIPGITAVVKLDDEECHFVLVAVDSDGDGRLNIAAPLATLLGMMTAGDVVKAWTPPRVANAETMRVELMEVIQNE